MPDADTVTVAGGRVAQRAARRRAARARRHHVLVVGLWLVTGAAMLALVAWLPRPTPAPETRLAVVAGTPDGVVDRDESSEVNSAPDFDGAAATASAEAPAAGEAPAEEWRTAMSLQLTAAPDGREPAAEPAAQAPPAPAEAARSPSPSVTLEAAGTRPDAPATSPQRRDRTAGLVSAEVTVAEPSAMATPPGRPASATPRRATRPNRAGPTAFVTVDVTVSEVVGGPELGAVLGTVEPFDYLNHGDGSITVDPAWVDRYIMTAQVPLLGAVRCNDVMIAPLRDALQQIVDEGLADAIDAGDYGGCWVPRRIDRNPAKPLSMHAWGLAIDFNVATNALGAAPTMDARVVEIFQTHGFAWGGAWSRPDGMHFEWRAAP